MTAFFLISIFTQELRLGKIQLSFVFLSAIFLTAVIVLFCKMVEKGKEKGKKREKGVILTKEIRSNPLVYSLSVRFRFPDWLLLTVSNRRRLSIRSVVFHIFIDQ